VVPLVIALPLSATVLVGAERHRPRVILGISVVASDMAVRFHRGTPRPIYASSGSTATHSGVPRGESAFHLTIGRYSGDVGVSEASSPVKLRHDDECVPVKVPGWVEHSVL